MKHLPLLSWWRALRPVVAVNLLRNATVAGLFVLMALPAAASTPEAQVQQFTLRTSIPQALKVTVGGRDIGAIGPADTLVKNVSLKPADLVARAEGAGAAQTLAPTTPVPPTKR